MSNLIFSDSEYFETQLSESKRNSSDIFLTKKAYSTLQDFEDDCFIFDLIEFGQVSLGAKKIIEPMQNQAFASYQIDGNEEPCLLTLQELLGDWVNTLDEEKVIVD